MPPKNDQIVVQNLRPPLKAPVFPSTSTEFINVMAHYHRAEIARMAGWRDRIDRTTNWAITVVAAMLSVSLSTPTAHHGVLIFAMVLVLLLLVIEARRYRFFDVYRNRVRRMERNYYAQIFAPQDGTTDDWILKLGEDLRQPLFLTSTSQALSRRLQAQLLLVVSDSPLRLAGQDDLHPDAGECCRCSPRQLGGRMGSKRGHRSAFRMVRDRRRGGFLRLDPLCKPAQAGR